MSMENVTELVEELISEEAEEAKKLKVGSEERSKAVKDLGELIRRRTEIESTEQNAMDMKEKRERQKIVDDVNTLDMYERREEQKRFNNESLKQKEEHNKTEFMRFITDVGLRTLQISLYGFFTNKTFEFNRNGDLLPSPKDTKYPDLLMRK